MKAILFLTSCLLTVQLFGQQQTFDIVTYTPPANWKEETGNTHRVYSRIDSDSWAQIVIYQHTHSSGDIHSDFEKEWNALAATPFNITAAPEKAEQGIADGWTVLSGSGIWQKDGANVATILTTYSNSQVCVSVLCNATAKPYLDDYKQFIAGLELPGAASATPAGSVSAQVSGGNATAPVTSPQPMHTGFQFNETTFEDGWKATAGKDWTTLSKGAIRILVHYPWQQTDQNNADKLKGDHNAWNTLVAPRYEQLENFVEAGIQDYESITFFMGDVREKTTGRKVFVVLYKKHYDKGNGRYLEVVSPSKAAFEQEFGNNYINRSCWEYASQIKSWNKLADMQGRNRFAVAATDLGGKWSSSTYESLTYYYIRGGFTSSTATAASIADEYSFQAGGTYQSDHAGASGVVGNQRFSRQVYKGKYAVSNWEMTLTNRFQGATEKYACYFEPVRGGRILMITDRNNTTISLVRQQ